MSGDQWSDVAVPELVDLVIRQRQALAEAGETTLAEHVHITVTGDGLVSLCYTPRVTEGVSSPMALRAVEIDPFVDAAAVQRPGDGLIDEFRTHVLSCPTPTPEGTPTS